MLTFCKLRFFTYIIATCPTKWYNYKNDASKEYSYGKKKKIPAHTDYIQLSGANCLGCGKYVLQRVYLQYVRRLPRRYFINGIFERSGGNPYHTFSGRPVRQGG